MLASGTATYIVVTGALTAALLAVALVLGSGSFRQRFTILALVAAGFMLAGILFGEDRAIGYGLFGIGVALIIVDLAIKRRVL